MLLNLLVRSKKTAAQDGVLFVDWGRVMYFSTWSCMVVMVWCKPGWDTLLHQYPYLKVILHTYLHMTSDDFKLK